MSLEKAIENLTEALNRHTQALLGGKQADSTAAVAAKAEQAPKERPQPEPEFEPDRSAPVEAERQPATAPVPESQPVKAEQTFDRHQLAQRNLQLIRGGKMTQMKALMAKFNVASFSALPDSQLAAWSAELDKLEG